MNISSSYRKPAPFPAVLAIAALATAPAAFGELTVQEVAAAKPGNVIREVSAYGPRVVWNEGSEADFFTADDDPLTQEIRHYPWTYDVENGSMVLTNEGEVAYTLREWDGGCAGAIVTEEDLILGSSCSAPAFRPLATEDGTYYVTGADGWNAEWRFRDMGGNTIVENAQYQGSFVGTDWEYREMESGRVLGAWHHEWCYGVPSKLVDATRGDWDVIAEPQFASWDGDWGTTYYDSTPCFLPNAVSWQSADSIRSDANGWDTTKLVVFRAGADDGELANAEVVFDGATNATLLAYGDDGSMLWEEIRGDGTAALVRARKLRGVWQRTTGHVTRRFDTGPKVEWGWDDDAGEWREMTNEAERVWVSPTMAAGMTRDGSPFFERLNDALTAKELVLCAGWSGGFEGPEVLDSVDWNPDEPDFAPQFSALPYRDGIVWTHPTGAKSADGEPLSELRAWVWDDGLNDYSMFTVATNVVAGAELFTQDYDYSIHLSRILSREVCSTNRLAFERVENGVCQLCVWDGESAADAPVVLASDYVHAPYFVVNVNAHGAAAAVNVGTAAAPDYRVRLAYKAEDAPTAIDLPAATELVEYSADLATITGIDDATWGLCTAYRNGGKLPANCTFDVASDGTLSGLTPLAGEYAFKVAAGNGGETTYVILHLEVEGNANLRPVVDSVTPAPGYANFGAATTLTFAIAAHDPEGRSLSYRWFVDGEEQPETAASFTLSRAVGDTSAHNVRCVIEDDLWTEANAGEDAVMFKWGVGVLNIVSASATPIHTGQRSMLSLTVESTTGFYASGAYPAGYDETTWFDAATGAEVGRGCVARAPADGSGEYYAVTTTKYGTVRTGSVFADSDPAPAAGRIYKLTGPALVGNRCVLHAGAWGDGPLTCEWTHEGVVVSRSRTLDITALTPYDFGGYTFTVSSARGSASCDYFLAPAAAGNVGTWARDGSEDALPPVPVSNAVQVVASKTGGIALCSDGTVMAWSRDNPAMADIPDSIQGKVVSVAASRIDDEYAVAVLRDGSVVVIGLDGESTGITGLADVVRVLPMGYEAYALHGDGTLTHWYRHGGECERIEGISDAVGLGEVDLGYYSETLILREDGNACCPWDGSDYVVRFGASSDDISMISNEMLLDGAGCVLEQFYDGAEEGLAYPWKTNRYPDAEYAGHVVAVDTPFDIGVYCYLTDNSLLHIRCRGMMYDITNAVAVSAGGENSSGIMFALAIQLDDAAAGVIDSGFAEWAAGHGLVPASPTRLSIVVAAMADWNGDGTPAWREYLAGKLPIDPNAPLSAEQAEFKAWLVENGLAGSGANAEAVAMAAAAARATPAANNAYSLFDCFVAGLNCEDPNAALKAEIYFDAAGNPVIDSDPSPGENREMRICGRRSLSPDDPWEDVTDKDLSNGEWRFFKVEVILKGSGD